MKTYIFKVDNYASFVDFSLSKRKPFVLIQSYKYFQTKFSNWTIAVCVLRKNPISRCRILSMLIKNI